MPADLIVCSGCGGVNRVPGDKPASAARCGKCGERLFDGRPRDVSGEIFRAQIARSSVPVLVDVWAPWCGPCHMMAPAYEQACADLEPRVRLVKLNSEAEPDIAGSLGIRSIPTMILFSDSHECARVSGAMTASQIAAWVRKHLGSSATGAAR